MRRVLVAANLTIALLCFAPPCFAGISADLASCANANSTGGARACTRLLESGRLRTSHYYIAYYNRGWAHRNSGNLEQALEDFNRSIEINPKFADTYYSRSVVRFEQADPEAALKDLEEYVRLKQQDWLAYYKRALMLRRLNKANRALADLETAEKLKPSAKGLRFLKALLLSDLNQQEAALELIGRKSGTDCAAADECYARSVVLTRKQLHDEALADLERAIEKRKNFAAAHTMKGQVLEKLGRRSAAMRAYKKAISFTVQSVEELLAQKESRERVAALEASDNIPVAESDVVETCRRFIPTSDSTISVPCE